MTSPEQTVATIFDLFEQFGHHAYGEALSQTSHMVQTAQLAAADGQSEEVIIAAFLHDLGHLLGDQQGADQMGEGLGAVSHEQMGAQWLLDHGFSDTIAKLVHGHVDAKRYLTWKYPAYYQTLSEASKQTLVAQGGPMNEQEGTAFEAHPLFNNCLKMRSWDDEAKQTGYSVPDLNAYREMILRHLNRPS